MGYVQIRPRAQRASSIINYFFFKLKYLGSIYYIKMPYKRKSSYRKKKKRSYRKRTPSRRIIRKDAFPTILRTKLRYNRNLYAVPSSTIKNQIFSLNFLFDPDITGGGQQPVYFDQLTAVYNRYRVRSCKYVITLSNFNTPVRYCVIATNNSTPVDIQAASANPYSKSGVINAMSNGGKSVKTITGYTSIKALLGEDLTDDRDQAVVTASPANVARLSILTESLDGSTNMSTWNCTVVLTYYCELFDRNPIDMS